MAPKDSFQRDGFSPGYLTDGQSGQGYTGEEDPGKGETGGDMKDVPKFWFHVVLLVVLVNVNLLLSMLL